MEVPPILSQKSKELWIFVGANSEKLTKEKVSHDNIITRSEHKQDGIWKRLCGIGVLERDIVISNASMINKNAA